MISKIYKDGSQWDRVIGRTVNSDGIISGWFGLTEAIEGDGYVAAGTMFINAPLSLDTVKTFGALTKLSLDGDSLWYREFSTIDTTIAFTEFRDVVAAKDGYMIIGDERCFLGFTGCDRLSSLLIVRTDAEGRVLPDSTSAVVTIDAERHLTAYPNPFTEELYLQHELGRSANYRLVDISGHVLIELEAEAPMHTYKIPVTSYVAGPYYIQLWEAGELRGTVKVVKQ